MSFQNSIGIDVQADKISLGWIKKSLKGLSFEAFEVHGHGPENNEDGLGNIGNIDVILADFTAKHMIKDFNLYIGIPETYCLTREIELPFSVRDEIGSVLQYEIEKYIPLSASKVEYGYKVISEDKSKGNVHVLLHVVKKEDLKPFLELKDYIPGGISAVMLTGAAVEEFEEHFRSGKKPVLSERDSPFDETTGEGKIKAAALAFQNFTKGKSRVNFLPGRFRKKPSKLPFVTFLTLLSLSFIALMVMGTSYYIHGRTQNRQLDTKLSYLKEQVLKVEKIEKRTQILEKKSNEIMSIMDNKSSILEILKELTVIIPADTFLKEFEFNKQIVRIKGMSKNASLLIKPIEAVPIFSGVGFESKISIKKNNQEAFIIKMKYKSGNEK